MKIIPKPLQGEFPPYASMYIDLVPNDGLLLHHFTTNLNNTIHLLCSLPEEKLLFRYAEGKWTIKEILEHIIDDERIYCYRALRFARNDSTELAGFEQDDYVKNANANQRSLEDLLDEFTWVRKATIAFFNGLEESALLRAGVANKNRVTVRALAYHIAGHELHHINIIKKCYLK